MEIAKTTGISIDKQILILSGGQSLKTDQKVIAYGAGAVSALKTIINILRWNKLLSTINDGANNNENSNVVNYRLLC